MSSQPSSSAKIVGQCPICHQTFNSTSDLRSHMEDPPNHDPPIDLDNISTGTFGELSGDEFDSDTEHEYTHKQKHAASQSSSSIPPPEYADFPSSAKSEEQPHQPFSHNGDFMPSDEIPEAFFSSNNFSDPFAESTSPLFADEDQGPGPAYTSPFSSAKPQGAIGVLYCKRCDGLFGNKKHYMRHFIFHPKHGEDSREDRGFYGLMWKQSWIEEAKEMEKRREREERQREYLPKEDVVMMDGVGYEPGRVVGEE